MAGSPVRVFVSHHHSPDEDAFTAHLVSDLEAAGVDVWVDDAPITSDDFIKKINEGLAGRQWLVLVMTPDSLISPWVQAEVNAALNQVGKNRMLGVIPVVAKPCDEADIPPLWDLLHRYDATRDYDTARDGLLRAMGLAPHIGHVALQSAPASTPREEAIRRRERRKALLAEKQRLEEYLAESQGKPTPFHFDAQREQWKNKLNEIENLLLEDKGRWHPKAPVLRSVGGAMDDYVEYWHFPCCAKETISDGAPSQYRTDGCEEY